jgi:predicted membrane protein
METTDIQDESKEEISKDQTFKDIQKRARKGRITVGVIILLAGGLLLIQRLNYWLLPDWLFTWPMILILIGLFTGIKNGFRFAGSIIMIGIGSIFLFQEIFSNVPLDRYLWPIILITVGLSFIFGRHNKQCGPGKWRHHKHYYKHQWGDQWKEQWKKDKWENWYTQQKYASTYDPGVKSDGGDMIDINAVFGSVKRTILSKNFKGGEVNTVMGACELNLTQADISGKVVLEINTVFGGTRIMVPPNWEVRSEMDSVLGSLEDKRPTHLLKADPEKILILKGASVLGGTELDLG